MKLSNVLLDLLVANSKTILNIATWIFGQNARYVSIEINLNFHVSGHYFFVLETRVLDSIHCRVEWVDGALYFGSQNVRVTFALA